MNLTGSSIEATRAALGQVARSTVRQLLIERTRDEPEAVALRFKRGGVFHELSWTGYLARVRTAAAGLLDLGVAPGDRVAIMGDACIEYLLADVAALYIGAMPCGIYPTSSPEEVAYVLELSGARVFVAEDQEHLDRLLAAEAARKRPLVDRIVVIDGRALFLYADDRILEFAALEAAVRAKPARLEEVERHGERVSPDCPAAIIFTSGTTGLPKAAYRSQSADIVGFGYAFFEALPELRAIPHRVVSHLPLAHGMERAMTIYVPLLASVVPHIGEPNQPLPALMNEVRPTYVMGVPRTWEKVMAHVHVGVEMASGLSRRLFALATEIGRRRVNGIWKTGQRRANLLTELAYWPLWLTMIWPALHKLGLTYTRGGFTGGAPTPPLVHETIQAWGIPLRDLFGTTETGCVGAQIARWPAPGDAIVPASCREVRAAADGELCIRGTGAVTGYWTDDKATAALFDADGFVQTGDIATYDADGAFRIVDRKKDILITSGGKNIAPATIENALRASPYISEVIVFGDSRKFITALIELDFENVAHWARQQQIPYTGVTSLAANDRVGELIGREIARLNQQLARVEQVKNFRILPKELIPEDGDTTPTRKIKRAHAYKLFGHLVEEMYAEDRRMAMPTGALYAGSSGGHGRAHSTR